MLFRSMWVNTDRWYPVKMEFYNSREELFKMLKTGEVREIDGYLSFKDMTMEDIKKGSKTELIIRDVQYDLDLNNSLFTVRSLKR